MRFIGLTGGIGSGKSTVARMFRELGAVVLDADAVYHELIAPTGDAPNTVASPLAQRIGERFPGVLKPDGSLDRRLLGERVFADADERRALGFITHPAVAAEVGQQTASWRQRGAPVVIYDVPLLFESGLDRGTDGAVVVWVPRETQLLRLIQRDGLTQEAAEQRLAAQLSLDDKKTRATWVVDNSGSVEATHDQVVRLWQTLLRLAAESTKAAGVVQDGTGSVTDIEVGPARPGALGRFLKDRNDP